MFNLNSNIKNSQEAISNKAKETAQKSVEKAAKKKAVQTEDILAEEEIEGLLESTLDFLDSLDNFLLRHLYSEAS